MFLKDYVFLYYCEIVNSLLINELTVMSATFRQLTFINYDDGLSRNCIQRFHASSPLSFIVMGVGRSVWYGYSLSVSSIFLNCLNRFFFRLARINIKTMHFTENCHRRLQLYFTLDFHYQHTG